MSLDRIEWQAEGRTWRADLARPANLAIELEFGGAQPAFFGAPPAIARPLASGGFMGNVSQGGSCNCSTVTLTPHCNGTHTECIGHVVREAVSVNAVARDALLVARLVTIMPAAADGSGEHSDPPPRAGDRWITARALAEALPHDDPAGCEALIVRTLPNPESKRRQQHGSDPAPPYFSIEAMRFVVERGYTHLVVDLPSVDRAEDDGRLAGHRIFWGLPAGSVRAKDATRADATLTELAYIDASVADGPFLLNLQVAPFAADAAPSRPVLFPVMEV